MRDLARKARVLVGASWWPWVIVVGLALVVSAFEAGGAILLFALLGLMTGTEGALVLPLIGDVEPYLAGIETTDLYLGAAVVIIVFFVLRALAVLAQVYVRMRVTEHAGARLSGRLHAGYLAMPYSGRGERNPAEEIRNAHDTVQRFVKSFFWPSVVIVSELVLVVVLLSVLLVTAPLATALVVVIVGPVVLLLNRIVQPRIQQLGRELQSLSTASLKVLQESLEGRDAIRLLGRERYFTRRFAAIRRGLARDQYLQETLGRVPAVGLETALVVFVAALLAVTVLVGDEALHVLPVLGLFGYVGLRLLPSLERLVRNVNTIHFAEPAIDDIYEEIRRVEPWLSDGEREDDPEALGVRRSIALARVTFRYPGTADDALRDVSLEIGKGQSVGIVGPTGGGKSTLVDIIVGLRRPDAGSVKVDGRDIHDHLRAWHRSVGVVPQTAFVMDETLRRNIALGEEDAEIDEDRISAALRLAQLDDFVASLPAGLDTVVGERGMRLSGGQRQRIAIARALYRDPELVVFDEGTAALDNATEAALLAALEMLRGSRTMLIVAHRLASVRRCDVVHLVADGRIVASGSFDELSRDSADFRELARLSHPS